MSGRNLARTKIVFSPGPKSYFFFARTKIVFFARTKIVFSPGPKSYFRPDQNRIFFRPDKNRIFRQDQNRIFARTKFVFFICPDFRPDRPDHFPMLTLTKPYPIHKFLSCPKSALFAGTYTQNDNISIQLNT